MKKHLAFALAAAAAAAPGCRSSAPDQPARAKAPSAAADPWGGNKVAVDGKDPDLAKMIDLAQNGPGTTTYPQADAIIALEQDDIKLQPDGTVVHHHKSIVKLLDAQRGKEKFADVHIPFDTTRETLDVQVARTVNADGKPHPASPDEIGDIVPPQLADATIYSGVRERVVSFPAVDKGSVVELEYTRTTKAGPDAALGGEELLGAWDPVLDRTVTITVASGAPSGTTPKFAVERVDLKPTESNGPDGHTWTFHLAKQPDRQPENGSPDEAAVLPRLVYGFAPSWGKVLDPVATRFLRAAVPADLPAAVKQQADQLVEGAPNDTAKAQKLFAFVAHDIRSVDMPLGWAGYQPNAPDVVLHNRYADQRDKVGLLLALAAAEGIHGRPVLTRTGGVPVIADVPTIAQFDRVVADLQVDGKDVWLDPTDEDGQYGLAFAGEDGLVLPIAVGGEELGHRAALDPSTSVAHVTAKLALSAGGDLDATYSYDLTGWYADRASEQLRPLKGENLDQYFERAAAALSAGALDKTHQVGDTMSVSGPVELGQHVAVPGYSKVQGNMRVLELPPVTLDFADDVPSASLSTRKYPLWVGVPRTEQGDTTVQLPAGWKIAYAPPKLAGKADGVSYESGCEIAGQTVTCHDQITLDKKVLTPQQYATFRDALTRLEAYERRVIVMQKA